MKIRPNVEGSDGALDGVGKRLRAARMAKGLSARQLAAQADVTPAYLSRLETGQLSPTVSTLSKVMQALGEPVALLFRGDDTPGPLVRREQRRVIRNHGVADELLSPTRSGRLEVLETVVTPHGGSGDEPYSHAGDEECIVLLSGRLHVHVRDTEYDLGPGDALTFNCRVPHSWTNPGPDETRALWIITPAGY
ncbi:MAG: XRE family transcriptional regulator [Pseudonocardiales bacterium]|nr:MAG: XRE family transcriptional regulator [Pseudonocardiales bacterium]